MDTSSDGIIIDISSDKFHIDPVKIRRIVGLLCGYLNLAAFELSLSFVDAEEMRGINRQFRAQDKSTDVLSFPQWEWTKPLEVGSLKHNTLSELLATPGPFAVLLLGDIVISLEDAARNAELIGQGVDRETCFLLIHGLLHLCGHDHIEPDEEELMLAQQKKLMALLDEAESPPPWSHCVQLRAGHS